MSLRKVWATAWRVLRQIRHDPRTLALILAVPCVLIMILKYVFDGQPQAFNSIAPTILGIFPLVVMFLVTSIATLRERTAGTLDRLMSMPVSKLDFILGYGLAFMLLGFLQACLASIVTLGLLDVTVQGGVFSVLVAAMLAAFLGTALGLFLSAFATSEFQAVQFMPAIIMPQLLTCGLFVAREHMAPFLQWFANMMPLSYSVDAMKQVVIGPAWSGAFVRDIAVVTCFGIVALIMGAVTIRRQDT